MFSQSRDDWRIVFRLYRGTLLIILFMFLIGVNVYGWRTSGVNHVLIFELDPRNHLSEQHLMEVGATEWGIRRLSALAKGVGWWKVEPPTELRVRMATLRPYCHVEIKLPVVPSFLSACLTEEVFFITLLSKTAEAVRNGGRPVVKCINAPWLGAC